MKGETTASVRNRVKVTESGEANTTPTTQSEHEALKDLPNFIPVGCTYRPRMPDAPDPQILESAQDLPSRLFIGNLDFASFSKNESGWSVRYIGRDPDTWMELGYSAQSQSLLLTQMWRGISGGTAFRSAGRLSAIIQYAYGPPPAMAPSCWDEVEKPRLEARFNIRYFPTLRDAHFFSFFSGYPDGVLKSVVCPVPVTKLRHTLDCIRSIQDDSEIAASVYGYHSLAASVVGYVENKCPRIPADPHRLFVQTMVQTGLPPARLPEWVTNGNGVRALSVSRRHYNFIVACAFRDLERVLEHFRRRRFIGDAESSDAGNHPDSPEFASLVMQAGAAEAEKINLSFSDSERTRWIWYNSFVSQHQPISLAVSWMPGRSRRKKL